MSICRSGLSPVVGYDSLSTLPAERLTKLIRMQACAYGMCVGGWRAVQVSTGGAGGKVQRGLMLASARAEAW